MDYRLRCEYCDYSHAIIKAFEESNFSNVNDIDTANKLFYDAVLGFYIAEKALKDHEHIYLSSQLFDIMSDIKKNCELYI